MYHIKNGIVYHNGQAELGLGQSYYASFHSKKMPVPPDGDQLGEMKKDIAAIKEFGFNMVRTAAIGKLSADENGVNIEAPLADLLMKELETQDLAGMVRIQGYSMNFSGYSNTGMINSKGVEIDSSNSFNFILDSLHHEGVLKDNAAGTRAIAEHFVKFPALCSFVTYNEPHYPMDGIYDYHPSAITAYRKWLTKKDWMSENTAASFPIPRERPANGENALPWILWRLFAVEAMSEFLADSADTAKSVNSEIAGMTCLTPNMLEFDNFIKCCDYFSNAERMDVLGLTLYKNCNGGDYYTTDMILSCAESAARLAGKHFWMLESDAATDITPRRLIQQALLPLGCGAKAIMYYQWRADYPFPGAPEPDGFGLLHYDKTPAKSYDAAKKMITLLRRLSNDFAMSEKLHSGVGILFSHYGAMYSDALDNVGINSEGKLFNRYMFNFRRFFSEMRRTQAAVSIVEAHHLPENKLNLRVLLVPDFTMLSEAEKEQVRSFKKTGGKVYIQAEDRWQPGLFKFGFEQLEEKKGKFDAAIMPQEILEAAGIDVPIRVLGDTPAAIDVLKNRDGYLASVINISNYHEVLQRIVITIPPKTKRVVFYSIEKEMELEIREGETVIPELNEGGILQIYH